MLVDGRAAWSFAFELPDSNPLSFPRTKALTIYFSLSRSASSDQISTVEDMLAHSGSWKWEGPKAGGL